ncbi:hypothetical protein VNI00_009156 [Paramarasmius palmivorus]|uniref:Uncharacterized protein n=1 Tax=Paramarasmius palmivorus TaxID=297713 RepID=A0AAW0CR75_9AGAR
MSEKVSFGETLSSGIQDIAALLPLLGTEQCEQHVGSALENGFLYAAAAPLSLFGSLGIVKVAFATFMATITRPFFGGKWLNDAGFKTPGSVSSMVTIDKATGRYGAEVKLEKLLKEQHIDDPTLVKGFAWSGWSRVHAMTDKGTTGTATTLSHKDKLQDRLPSWNIMLILCSTLSMFVSITPYLFLTNDDWSRPLSWLFPLLRSFGSFLCAVAIQLALQLRIHCITKMSLAWIKIRRKYHVEDAADPLVEPNVLESRIRSRVRLPRKSPVTDEEKQPDLPLSSEERSELVALLATDWYLVAYQVMIAIGMGMVVTGYVGCFSLVGQTDPTAGPYVWFGLETALSLLRIFLWGSNPSWDEGTGLAMSLQLHPLHGHGDPNASDPYFPLITSPYDGSELRLHQDQWGEYTLSPQAFIVQNEADFLGMATAWVGPLERLESNAITLFYSILIYKQRKRLFTTIQFLDSRTSLTFSPDATEFEIYSSTLGTIPFTRAVQLTLGDPIVKRIDAFINSQLYHEVVDHSQTLSMRLFSGHQVLSLEVSWNLSNLSLTSDSAKRNLQTSQYLSSYDDEYTVLQGSWSSKAKYCRDRGQMLEAIAARYTEYCKETIDHYPASLYGELLFFVESAILELQLWREETRLIANMGDEKLSRHAFTECIRAMQSRITVEKQQAVGRYAVFSWEDGSDERLIREWDGLQRVLVQLRESEYLHGKAEMLLSFLANLSPRLDLASSIEELGWHLDGVIPEFTKTDSWIRLHNHCGLAEGGGTIPNPSYKLKCMSYLMMFRLRSIISHIDGFLIASSDIDLWTAFIEIPDSATWGTYIYSFAPDVVDSSAQHVAVEVLLPSSEIALREQWYASTGGAKGYSLREHFDLISTWSTLSTLVVRTSYISEDARSLICEFVRRNPNIICLSRMECHRPGQPCVQAHCQAVVTNREVWKQDAMDRAAFDYRVGFEGFGPSHVVTSGDHVRLFSRIHARCFILGHCPDTGNLAIRLSVQSIPHGNNPPIFRATLSSDLAGDEEQTECYTIREQDRPGQLEDVVFSFSNVSGGPWEMAIHSDHSWELHGVLRIVWIPKSHNPT